MSTSGTPHAVGPTILPLDERRLRFEARRLAVETFVRLHIEQVAASRQFLLTHLRLMFTLSLGALASVVTLYGAGLRLGTSASFDTMRPLSIVVATVALLLLTCSALMSARSLQAAARAAGQFLADPFPDSEKHVRELFERADIDEQQILAQTVEILDRRLIAEAVVLPNNGLNIALLVLGIACAVVPFLI